MRMLRDASGNLIKNLTTSRAEFQTAKGGQLF